MGIMGLTKVTVAEAGLLFAYVLCGPLPGGALLVVDRQIDLETTEGSFDARLKTWRSG